MTTLLYAKDFLKKRMKADDIKFYVDNFMVY